MGNNQTSWSVVWWNFRAAVICANCMHFWENERESLRFALYLACSITWLIVSMFRPNKPANPRHKYIDTVIRLFLDVIGWSCASKRKSQYFSVKWSVLFKYTHSDVNAFRVSKLHYVSKIERRCRAGFTKSFDIAYHIISHIKCLRYLQRLKTHMH